MTNQEKAKEMAEAGVVPQAQLVFGRKLQSFSSKWQEMDRISEEIKALTARKKELSDELVGYFADSSHKTVLEGTTRITLAFGKNTSLSKELLLQNGVTANVIEKSTKSTEYVYVKVTHAKDKE